VLRRPRRSCCNSPNADLKVIVPQPAQV
jgi:hypothetical protein